MVCKALPLSYLTFFDTLTCLSHNPLQLAQQLKHGLSCSCVHNESASILKPGFSQGNELSTVFERGEVPTRVSRPAGPRRPGRSSVPHALGPP